MGCGGTVAPWTASLTFGGPDPQTLEYRQPARH